MFNNNTAVNERFRQLIKAQPVLIKLIIVNVIVWFTLNLIQLADYLMHSPESLANRAWLEQVIKFIAVPASIQFLIAKPWTIITYMFVQEDFWHLFFNMVWLFWFGKIFLEFLNGRKLLTIYILGGFAGALAFIAAYNFFPAFLSVVEDASNIGASASVLAITIATAVLVPSYIVNLLFLGPVKIKYIAIFVVILDVLMIRSGNAGGHFAHIGGAIFGALYILVSRDLLNGKSIFKNLDFKKLKFKRKRNLKNVYKNSRPLTDEEYNKIRVEKQTQIDEILDKISRSGYSSLSAQEKEYLFKSSK